MGRWPLGVTHVVFGGVPVAEAARRAAELGFEHIDVPADVDEPLALPVGDRVAFPHPRPGCSTPAPPADGPDSWQRAVERYRAAPGSLLEPWPGSVVGSIAAVRAFLEEVPGLRLLVDTGHVATWGEDPTELLPWADHVQLRQARRGEPQTLEGDVDFRAVFRRLREVDYQGRLSIEYLNLPDLGLVLDDPVGAATALAAQLRPLLEEDSW